jgi:hypothetical protein
LGGISVATRRFFLGLQQEACSWSTYWFSPKYRTKQILAHREVTSSIGSQWYRRFARKRGGAQLQAVF